jgi:hypothetical protein
MSEQAKRDEIDWDNPYAWPWWLRYPASIAVAALGTWLATRARSEGMQWLVGGLTALFALMLAYEIGCLALIAAFVWVVYALSSFYEAEAPAAVQSFVKFAAIAVACGYAVKWVLELLEKLNSLERHVEELTRAKSYYGDRLDWLEERERERQSAEYREPQWEEWPDDPSDS